MSKKENTGQSHLRIDNEILRSKLYAKFMWTREAAVWFYLCSWIIRGEMSNHGLGKKLYEDFYLNQRKLVARWDQEKIAEHFGISSKGYISRLLKKLDKDWDIIKTVKIQSYNSHQINVYVLGYIDGLGCEHLYFTQKFRKHIADENLSKFKDP